MGSSMPLCSTGMSLARLHATMQALQPIQIVESYNMPTACGGMVRGSRIKAWAGAAQAATPTPVAVVFKKSRRFLSMIAAPYLSADSLLELELPD
jgi:hypothetical protein